MFPRYSWRIEQRIERDRSIPDYAIISRLILIVSVLADAIVENDRK